MFFRGTQFQRDGHARYNLLLTRTLLNDSADLSPLGILALTAICPPRINAGVIAQGRHRQTLHGRSERYFLDTTPSTFSGAGPAMRLCHRRQFAPSRSPLFEWYLVDALVVDHPPTRVKVLNFSGEKRQSSCRTDAYTTQRRVRFAQAAVATSSQIGPLIQKSEVPYG